MAGSVKKIIVCSSRTFADRDFVFGILDTLLEEEMKEGGFLKDKSRTTFVEIVEGGCPTGGDSFAREWAKGRKQERTTFHADWSQGRKAGPLRDTKMADYAGPDGICVAFRNATGKSNGTDDMIVKAQAKGMKVFIYRR